MSNVEFILDEAAMLGPMASIDNAVGIGRGYGIRLYFYYQSLSQLRKCFPDGQDQTLLSNVSQIFFAANDYPTAEYVSSRLGEETIILDSGGTSRGTSSSTQGGKGGNSESSSFNRNFNWNQQARKLLKPEEVIALSPRTAIIFTPGLPPIWTTMVRSYEEKNLGALVGAQNARSHSIGELFKAILYFAIASFIALFLTAGLQIHLKQIDDAGSERQSNYTEQGVDHVTTGE